MYSSLNDMLAFGRSILRSDQLSRPRTRRWLKPWTFAAASSLRDAVGAPWEISRIALPPPVTPGRAVDVYTKSGAVPPAYASLLVLVPDYGVALALLFGQAPPTAPPASATDVEASVGPLSVAYATKTLILSRLLPVVEGIARQQAAANYAGQYTAAASPAAASAANATTASVVRIAVDSGPGLRVTAFRARGKDVLALLTGDSGSSSSSANPVFSIRLYPTGLESNASSTDGSSSSSSSSATATKRVSFRAVYLPEPRRPTTNTSSHQAAGDGDTGSADGNASGDTDRAQEGQTAGAADREAGCPGAWSVLDRHVYGSHAMTEVIFHLAADGQARRIELPAWQLVLERAAVAPATTLTTTRAKATASTS
jgi:hypothetical protein